MIFATSIPAWALIIAAILCVFGGCVVVAGVMISRNRSPLDCGGEVRPPRPWPRKSKGASPETGRKIKSNLEQYFRGKR